jgi:hypothetical protein
MHRAALARKTRKMPHRQRREKPQNRQNAWSPRQHPQQPRQAMCNRPHRLHLHPHVMCGTRAKIATRAARNGTAKTTTGATAMIMMTNRSSVWAITFRHFC